MEGVDPRSLWAERRTFRGRPPAHSREAVVTTAIGVADAEGLSAVTMRRVASALGSGTMSLYTYVSERDALLELMIDAVMGEQDFPFVTGDWRADLADFARSQRALMRRHPWLPAALTSRRTMGPNTLVVLEHALGLLEPTGLTPRARLETFALVSGFVASQVGYEVAQEQLRGASAEAKQFAEAQARYMAEVAESGEYPRLAEAMAASGGAAQPDPDETFERLLERVINGLL